jgi:hypothetical protein
VSVASVHVVFHIYTQQTGVGVEIRTAWWSRPSIPKTSTEAIQDNMITKMLTRAIHAMEKKDIFLKDISIMSRCHSTGMEN